MKFGTCPNFHHRKSVCTFHTTKSELNSELGRHCRVRQFGGLLGNKYTRNQQMGLIENWWQAWKNFHKLTKKQKTKRNTSLYLTYQFSRVSAFLLTKVRI
jgi:hypothetical protein